MPEGLDALNLQRLATIAPRPATPRLPTDKDAKEDLLTTIIEDAQDDDEVEFTFFDEDNEPCDIGTDAETLGDTT